MIETLMKARFEEYSDLFREARNCPVGLSRATYLHSMLKTIFDEQFEGCFLLLETFSKDFQLWFQYVFGHFVLFQ